MRFAYNTVMVTALAVVLGCGSPPPDETDAMTAAPAPPAPTPPGPVTDAADSEGAPEVAAEPAGALPEAAMPETAPAGG